MSGSKESVLNEPVVYCPDASETHLHLSLSKDLFMLDNRAEQLIRSAASSGVDGILIQFQCTSETSPGSERRSQTLQLLFLSKANPESLIYLRA
ncbi:hypothetical protein HanXRQr2_Chr17g0791231 [Helianthus annuus]|uniref:Uncharacterized protein n=1 Tax=Helianthus annuus TaxID=4232 RepID=A0A9K3DFH7_HELAN|nr:hypothetical protein HanXRQr2_Chr17g0791231 [Helianthus annuus]KAJ0812188.1 hypothetical protein HanPSC8_Chr17g0759131 [Helianthus annuus]